MFWRHATPRLWEGIIVVSGQPIKIFQCGYYCPTIHQDAHEFVKECGRCQIDGGISRKQELSLNLIIVIELFDVWGIDFMGTFVCSHGMKYILVPVDDMSKFCGSHTTCK